MRYLGLAAQALIYGAFSASITGFSLRSFLQIDVQGFGRTTGGSVFTSYVEVTYSKGPRKLTIYRIALD
jgi:hypothetical protein